MYYNNDPRTTQEWYSERLETAAQQRYAHRILLRSGRLSLSERLFAWLGRRLISLGQSLEPQQRLDGFADSAVKRGI